MRATSIRPALGRRVCAGCAVVAALICALPATGRADGPRPYMEDYFAGEKAGGLSLIAMGVAGAGGGVALVTRDSDFAQGLGYPLLAVGALHAAAGVFVITSSNGRIDEFGPWIERDAADFVDKEHARMKGVQTQFFVLKIVEGVLIAGGVGLVVYGETDDRPTLSGVGAGIAIEAAATLVFDIIAARRAAEYVAELGSLQVTAAPDSSGIMTYGAGFTGRF